MTNPTCRRCDVEMRPGQALENIPVGSDDFGGDAGQPGTAMHSGPDARLVPCWKCPVCGDSTVRAFRFRWHRGTLADSLATEITLASRAELVEHINDILLGPPVRDEDLQVEFYGHDDRIDRDLYVAVIRGVGVAGFTDRMI